MSKIVKKKQSKTSLPSSAFDNPQLSLFQNFLCNTDSERNKLSNTIDLWDSVPRYAVSRQAMNKLRTPQGFLELLKIDFNYKGTNLKAIIQPARIEEKDGKTLDYYPSASEELVEHALRKIAAEQSQGYFDQSNYRSGAVFTLYMLREELRLRGHTRSYQQIIQSLTILSKSTIEIRGASEKGEGVSISTYLPTLITVSKKKLEADPDAKWMVQFHPLVTQSIDQLTYRQFNYHQMMSHSTQLGRWLHTQLSLKFTFASVVRPFEMRYSTVKRDSALLNNYERERKAIEVLDAAFEELKAQNVLSTIQKEEIRGQRNKLEDVVYRLSPSLDFISAMKAANKRINQITENKNIL